MALLVAKPMNVIHQGGPAGVCETKTRVPDNEYGRIQSEIEKA